MPTTFDVFEDMPTYASNAAAVEDASCSGRSVESETELLSPEARLLDEIENCPLIEKPPAEKAKGNLKHDLSDCKGYLAEVPFREPNADTNEPQTVIEEIMRGNGSQVAQRSKNFGTLVPPGCIGVYEHNGKIKAVGPGRWRLLALRSHWIKARQQLDENVILQKTLLIIRIPAGEFALVRENGNPIFLSPGTHVFNNGLVQYVDMIKVRVGHLDFSPYHIMLVPRGEFFKVWARNDLGSISPRLLSEGMHLINDALFRYEDSTPVMQDYIKHGTVHIIQVPRGMVAKVIHNNLPRLLGEGTHPIEAVNFEYCGTNNLSDKVINHKTITIVRVSWGEIGVAWERNQPLFNDKAGLYAFNSPDFTFVSHISSNERVVELGAKKIIMVYTGEVGISYDHGKLKVLKNGRHIIDSSNHIFEGFLSTQQKSIRLVTLTDEEKRKSRQPANSKKLAEGGRWAHDLMANTKEGTDSAGSSDHVACETKDLVKVGVRADVFYSIMDPEKAITRISVDEIEDLVRETAISTLNNIIRSTALNEIAQSKHPNAIPSDQAKHPAQPVIEMTSEESTSLFFDKAHDEFLSKLHDDFMGRYGIEINNIRIESFKIMDDELADSISKQALVTAQTENELANLQGRTEIATAQQMRDAEVMNIKANAEARALQTQNDAENSRRLASAKAAAESRRIEVEQAAKAEADAIITKAKAEAEAIRLVADAESKRAELLSRTVLGGQTALLNIYADMVKKASEGVEKVVYCDPSLMQNGNVFMMPNLGNLNGDLEALGDVCAMKGPAGKQTRGSKQ